MIGFLVAILVLAHLCDDDGLFRACGAWMARSAAGRTLRQHGSEPDLGEFTRLGLLTAPAGLVLAVLALWAGLRVMGG